MSNKAMAVSRFVVPLSFGFFFLVCRAQTSLPDHSQPEQSLPDAPSAALRLPQHSKPQGSINVEFAEEPWPRKVTHGDETISMYPPQVETWEGDEVRAYAAIAVVGKSQKAAKYGVVWFTAQTEVDKVNRQVTLDNFQITRAKFPTMQAKEAEYQAFLQGKLLGKSKMIALDRLEAALAVSDSEQAGVEAFEVSNDPPEIIFSTKPSLLVVVDGPPRYRDVGSSGLQLMLNTRATIVLDTKTREYYLNVMDGWLQTPDLMAGPWSYVSKTPLHMEEITKDIQERQQGQAPDKSTPHSLKEAEKEGKVPAIYVCVGPCELLVTEGPPQFEIIPDTELEFVKNTTANIFRDSATPDYYTLLAGRWFRSRSLERGPWEFVNGKSLPGKFAHIPENSPKAGVLVSVPGTGPAKEALIANAIPQTATITRHEARLDVKYDGEPQFRTIEGTDLQYAVNSATPIIKVDANNYYAVENAVWFVGPSPAGPWAVADSVPIAIYSIPPSSSLHYVTYVKVYRSTPDVVHVGYTPGYYGTVVSSSTSTVVYGTGWYYPPYVGNYWYGAPYTYGVGAASTWSSESGWSVTIGVGYANFYPYYYPWWGPWGYFGPCCWGPAWRVGYAGYVGANVYGRWGNTAYTNTHAAWANSSNRDYRAANRSTLQNVQRGTVDAAGHGAIFKAYAGNTVAGRGTAGYNPRTGVTEGAGAADARDTLPGQGPVRRDGAAGSNNVYAGKNGEVFRYNQQTGNWSQNGANGWKATSSSPANLQQQQHARALGQQRMQNFSGSMGGGMRMGGRRR